MTDKLENMGEGRQIVRDEYGRIKKMVLTSEAARAMAQARAPAKARDTTSSQLLAEAGFNDTNQAPEHLRLLSELASSGRSGAVAALRDFRKLTTRERSEPAPSNMREVEPLFDDGNWDCVKIGGGAAYVRITGHFFGDLVREVRELDEQLEAAASEPGAGGNSNRA